MIFTSLHLNSTFISNFSCLGNMKTSKCYHIEGVCSYGAMKTHICLQNKVLSFLRCLLCVSVLSQPNFVCALGCECLCVYVCMCLCVSLWVTGTNFTQGNNRWGKKTKQKPKLNKTPALMVSNAHDHTSFLCE